MYPKFEWDPKIEVCWNAPHPLWKIKVYVSCNPTISTKSPDIPYGHFVCWESIQRFDKKLLDLDGFYMLLYNEKPTNFHGNLQRFPLARKPATSSSSAFSEVVRQWMLNSKRGVLPESREADATMGAMDIFVWGEKTWVRTLTATRNPAFTHQLRERKSTIIYKVLYIPGYPRREKKTWLPGTLKLTAILHLKMNGF